VFDPATPDLDALIDSICQAPETVDEHLVADSSELMADLVDEIMVQDMDNVSEVKQIKAAISNKLRRSICELRQQYSEKQKLQKRGRKKTLGRPPKPKAKAKGKGKASGDTKTNVLCSALCVLLCQSFVDMSKHNNELVVLSVMVGMCIG
jgi:hypothetical protein